VNNIPHLFTAAKLGIALRNSKQCYDRGTREKLHPGPEPACCPLPKCFCKSVDDNYYPKKFENHEQLPVDGPWQGSLWHFPLLFNGASWCGGGGVGHIRIVMDDHYDYVGIIFHTKDENNKDVFKQCV